MYIQSSGFTSGVHVFIKLLVHVQGEPIQYRQVDEVMARMCRSTQAYELSIFVLQEH